MIKKIGTLILMQLFLNGCLTTGKDFPSDLSWIKKEKTSTEDVQLILGNPFAVGNSGGVRTWTYAFYKYKIFGSTSHKDLKIYWNSKNLVQHFSFNSSFPEDFVSSEVAKEKAQKDLSKTKKEYPTY